LSAASARRVEAGDERGTGARVALHRVLEVAPAWMDSEEVCLCGCRSPYWRRLLLGRARTGTHGTESAAVGPRVGVGGARRRGAGLGGEGRVVSRSCEACWSRGCKGPLRLQPHAI